jgi:hypothetical protein
MLNLLSSWDEAFYPVSVFGSCVHFIHGYTVVCKLPSLILVFLQVTVSWPGGVGWQRMVTCLTYCRWCCCPSYRRQSVKKCTSNSDTPNTSTSASCAVASRKEAATPARWTEYTSLLQFWFHITICSLSYKPVDKLIYGVVYGVTGRRILSTKLRGKGKMYRDFWKNYIYCEVRKMKPTLFCYIMSFDFNALYPTFMNFLITSEKNVLWLHDEPILHRFYIGCISSSS